jgi:O-antigen/teichoic acid export membrane protein
VSNVLTSVRGTRALSGAGMFYVARLVPGLCNFLLVLFATHQLAPAEYGRFSIWLATLMGCGVFFFGWLAQGIARHANGKDDELSKRPETFRVGLVLAGLAVLVCNGFAALLGLIVLSDAVLITVGTLLWGAHSVLVACLQAKLLLRFYVRVEAMRAVATVATVVVAMYLFGQGFLVASLGYIVGLVLALGASISSLPRQLSPFADIGWHLFLRKSRLRTMSRVRTIFRYGAPISAWLGLLTLWPAIERNILGFVSSTVEVGIYAAEYDIVFRSFVFVLLPITLYAQPMIFREYANENIDAADRLIKCGLAAQLLIGVAFASVYFVLATRLFPAYGLLDYVRPVDMALLCGAAIVWQAALLSHKWLECTRQVVRMFAALTCSLLAVSVPIAVVLFPIIGTAAFALGFLCGGLGYSAFCYVNGRATVRRRVALRAAALRAATPVR